jgi:hypothetical protein
MANFFGDGNAIAFINPAKTAPVLCFEKNSIASKSAKRPGSNPKLFRTTSKPVQNFVRKHRPIFPKRS